MAERFQFTVGKLMLVVALVALVAAAFARLRPSAGALIVVGAMVGGGLASASVGFWLPLWGVRRLQAGLGRRAPCMTWAVALLAAALEVAAYGVIRGGGALQAAFEHLFPLIGPSAAFAILLAMGYAAFMLGVVAVMLEEEPGFSFLAKVLGFLVSLTTFPFLAIGAPLGLAALGLVRSLL